MENSYESLMHLKRIRTETEQWFQWFQLIQMETQNDKDDANTIIDAACAAAVVTHRCNILDVIKSSHLFSIDIEYPIFVVKKSPFNALYTNVSMVFLF